MRVTAISCNDIAFIARACSEPITELDRVHALLEKCAVKRIVGALVLVLSCSAFAAEDRLALLSPDTIAVATVDGKGEVPIAFVRCKVKGKYPKGGLAEVPSSFDISSLPGATRDQVKFVPSEPTGRYGELPTYEGTLKVDLSTPLIPGASAGGKITFVWDGTDSTYQRVPYTVTESPVAAFDLQPSKVSLTVTPLDPVMAVMRISNTGPRPIASYCLSSVGLLDATTQSALHLDRSCESLRSPLLQGFSQDVRFTLPDPIRAGTYSGSIDIAVNGRSPTKSLPVTVVTRGPWGRTWCPFGLWLLVIVVGYGLSNLLDAWRSSGNAGRVEAILLLQAQSKRLKDTQDRLSESLAKAKADPPVNNKARADAAQVRISTLIARAPSYTPEQLRQNADATEGDVANCEAFADVIGSLAPETLKAKLDALDKVPVAPIPADYRRQLAAAASGRDIGGGGLKTGLALIRRQHWIDKIFWILKPLIVLAVSYTTTFQRPAFGSANDYVQLFVWSLGLTQAGSAVLGRLKG
jgi:hypothetical protein